MITEEINYTKAAETLKTHLGLSGSSVVVEIAESADELPEGSRRSAGRCPTKSSGVPDGEMVMGSPAEMLTEVAEAVQIVTGAPGSV